MHVISREPIRNILPIMLRLLRPAKNTVGSFDHKSPRVTDR